MSSQYFDLAPEAIHPSPHNPRKTVDEAGIAELAESIRAVGLLEPLIVRVRGKRGDGTRYELVCGERRWRAATALGLERVPCRVIVATDEQALELALVENSQRVDVDPFEEAGAIGRLVAYGRSVEDVGARLGRSPRWVRRRLALRLLPDELVEMVRAGSVPLGGAELIAALDPARRTEVVSGLRPDMHYDVRWLRALCSSRRLADATWPLDDEGMAGETGYPGPCSTCPRRSTVQIDLWGAVEGEGECLSPSCYDARLKLVVEHRKAWARRQGLPVIENPPWAGAPTGYIAADDQVEAGLAIRLGLRTPDDLGSDVEDDDEDDDGEDGEDVDPADRHELRDGREVTWRDVLDHLGVGGVDAIVTQRASYGRDPNMRVEVGDLISRDRLARILEEAGEPEVAARYRPYDREAAARRDEEDQGRRRAREDELRAQLLAAWDAASDGARVSLIAQALRAEPHDWDGLRTWAGERWWDVDHTLSVLSGDQDTAQAEEDAA